MQQNESYGLVFLPIGPGIPDGPQQGCALCGRKSIREERGMPKGEKRHPTLQSSRI